MTNNKLLYTGLSLGLLTVVIFNVYTCTNQQAYTLLKFKQPLNKDQKISVKVLESVSVPKNFGSLLKEAVTYEERNWVEGKVLLNDAAQGDYLLRSHISASPDEDLDKRLDKNKRALSIQVTNEGSVSGFVEPGSFVDIVATLAQAGDKQGGKITTKTILQKVKVLAVGDRSLRRRISGPDAERQGSTTVTFELTPIQVEKILFAQQHAQGPLTLVLVNPESAAGDIDVVSWENFDTIK